LIAALLVGHPLLTPRFGDLRPSKTKKVKAQKLKSGDDILLFTNDRDLDD